MTSHSPVLEINGLKVYFQTSEGITRAVDDVSFSISRGETFALVGESGSGKSVTALAIMRLVQQPAGKYAGGSIRLNGCELLTLPESGMRAVRGARAAMIFQEPMSCLNPVFTIGNQIMESVLTHQRVSRARARRIAIDMLDQVNIAEPERRFNSYPHQLSGGMKQRAMIAMALCCNPDLLIADEPTTALDVTVQAQILALLKELQQQRTMAILFITHDLGIVFEQADRVAVMQKGSIVETNSVRGLFKAPQHHYTRLLLDAVPCRAHRRQERVLSEPSAADMKLRVRNLSVRFPVRQGFFSRKKEWFSAVDNVDFDIPSGKTVALVGESGCGKTTIGKCLVQLLKPSAGSILFDNTSIYDSPGRLLKTMRKKIQIVFQDPYASLNPRMLIGDIIAEGMLTHGIGRSRRERLDMAAGLLERVGLSPAYISRYPHEFSGGQRQRICIARALAVQPELIVCDEATSALDVSIQAQILELLQHLQRESNLTYLFITHNLGLVDYLADYVLVMYRGAIVERGLTAQVFSNPAHPYTRSLLAAVPQIRVG
ncbi:MAG: ABC transporter ATP-binding protein [Deltaproteobacteria bacterium]|nr:ABC transporter ATP-binding protein [Deltaproteobacteria bacterium]